MTPLQKLRAALYGRVSLDPYGKSRSPGQQHSAGHEVCADEGWAVAGIYADSASASRLTKKAREDWARLLGDIRAGRIDVVIVWEWSRADRNLVTGAEFLQLCRERGVLIHVVIDERTYDVKKRAKDWEILAKSLVDNAMEVEKTSDRSKRDRAERVALGIVDGKIAYGYRRVYDPNTREFIRQEEDPETAKVVREIIRRVVAGEPVSCIAKSLTERGVPTPNAAKKNGGTKWHRSVVRDIAINPAYIARRSVDGKLWPVDWPALVSEADYFEAVRILTDPARMTTRPGRAVWLLTHIATCFHCGGGLVAVKRGTNRDGSAKRMYECGEKGCAAILIPKLDEAVETALFEYLSRPHVHAALGRPDDSASQAIRAELAELETERRKWIDLAGTGLDPETIATALRKVDARIADAKARREALGSTSGALRVLLGEEPSSYDVLMARWEHELVVAQRREIIRELFTVQIGRAKRTREPGLGVVGDAAPRLTITPLRKGQ